jgi:hypothetical protein
MAAQPDPIFNEPAPIGGAAPPAKPPPRPFWRRLFGGRDDAEATLDPRQRRRWPRRIALGVFVLVLLYYPVGMAIMHRIGDDVRFAAAPVGAKESRAVAVAVAVVDREVNVHRWTANDPFFMPSYLLDNLPNFQLGLVAAVQLFVTEMRDNLARSRGSSAVDPDLARAAGQLNTEGTRWIWNPSVSIWPRSSAEQEYRQALKHLREYNARLAADKAVFERRADNLQVFVDRINKDLGSMSQVIADRVDKFGDLVFDTRSDDIYYQTKGRLYAYYLILRELGEDFAAVLRERQLETLWKQMLETLRVAAGLQPLIVRNGRADSLLMPSHLAAQGFFLLRARVQLREIADILQK